MSEPTKERPKVPEGKAACFTTRQKAPTEKGFIGYETTWVSWHKEVEYKTPKRP